MMRNLVMTALAAALLNLAAIGTAPGQPSGGAALGHAAAGLPVVQAWCWIRRWCTPYRCHRRFWCT